ncbi:hypothetical protein PGB90_001237 [Kerria lacca]
MITHQHLILKNCPPLCPPPCNSSCTITHLLLHCSLHHTLRLSLQLSSSLSDILHYRNPDIHLLIQFFKAANLYNLI